MLVFDAAIRVGVLNSTRALPQWRKSVIPLVESLTSAGAYWAPKILVQGSIDYLRNSREFDHNNDDVQSILRELQGRLHTLEARYDDTLAELAADLRDYGRRPPALACVAAAYWVLGDVSRATAISRGQYWPSFRRLRALTIESVRRIPIDPLVHGVWNRFQNKYGQFHGFGRMLSTPSALEPVYSEVPLLFGEILIGVFEHRRPADHMQELDRIMHEHGRDIWERYPSLAFRIMALRKIARFPGAEQQTWPLLCGAGAVHLEHTSGPVSSGDDYDLATSIACHYLSPEDADILGLLEQYRAAALWYWAHLLPQGPAADDRTEHLWRSFRLAKLIRSDRREPGLQFEPNGPDADDKTKMRERIAHAGSDENIAALNRQAERVAAGHPEVPSPHNPATVEMFAAALTLTGPP
ncbi:hypothetical protein AB0E01_31750 [Nocardia vinacea]|uniref:hypothetical protein n=1 Tax=Nocardia vinacea TaxID=96468 RepID=UPI0033EBF2BA